MKFYSSNPVRWPGVTLNLIYVFNELLLVGTFGWTFFSRPFSQHIVYSSLYQKILLFNWFNEMVELHDFFGFDYLECSM